MNELELNDIQGYVIHDYPTMLFSRYVMLQVSDQKNNQPAKEWLAIILESITHAEISVSLATTNTALNIAVTAAGLTALGMNQENIRTFSREFREGMVSEHRIRLLGDEDSSSPDRWQWGNNPKSPEHIVLMIFGQNETIGMAYHQRLSDQYLQMGLTEVFHIDGKTLQDNKEHFGFRDGISQPIPIGSGIVGPDKDMLQPGEFILGYKNEYHVYPQSPMIEYEEGDINLLPPDSAGSGKKDLGKNGTYLVLRQLDQDVDSFWTFMNERTKNEDGTINEGESIKLAAKMMGRWPNGAPITKYPDKDPGNIGNVNDFGYAAEDSEGLKCPFGAHIRRTNPRDSFEDDNVKTSMKLSNRHRIIRRARLYGEPIISSPDNHSPSGTVGLLFNCFNADISRQFEFIQYTWANLKKTKQLYNDPDPIIGVKEKPHTEEEQNFTIQDHPVNHTVNGLRRFVTVRGGAYLFFPSLTALRYIATI